MTKKETQVLNVTTEEISMLEELLLAHIKYNHMVYREYVKYHEVAYDDYDTYREGIQNLSEVSRIANSLLIKV